MKKKAKLILGGGSAYGLAHIGALAAIVEQYEISGIIGTSMGAIIGACFAYGYSPAEILDLAINFKTAELYSPLNLDLSRRGIFDGQAILKSFQKITSRSSIEQGKIPFVAVAYDLVQNRSILIDKGSFADAMRASSSLPYVFAPHSYGKYLLIDGGVEHPLPVAFAEQVPGEICIAVNVLPQASTSAEAIELSRNRTNPKLNLHQVFIQSLLQNQAFIALQEVLEHQPDIFVDAHCGRLTMLDFNKADEFYRYGLIETKDTLLAQKENGKLDSLLLKYQKIIQKIKNPLSGLLSD